MMLSRRVVGSASPRCHHVRAFVPCDATFGMRISRRLLVTLRVPRVTTSFSSSKEVPPTLSITGFGANFLPTVEQCLLIMNRSLRPLLDNGEPIPLAKAQVPDDLFTEFLSYTNKSSGEGEVIVRLKNNDYLPYLPIARLPEDTEATFNESTRFAWAGVLLPVFNNKIVMLSAKQQHAMKVKRQWEKIHWFPLYFRRFQPSALHIELDDEQVVRNILKTAHPNLEFETVEEARADTFDDLVIHRKKKKQSRRSYVPGVELQCESGEDVFTLRKLFAEKGIECRPVRKVKYDSIRAFRESRFNDSVSSSGWVRKALSISKQSVQESPMPEGTFYEAERTAIPPEEFLEAPSSAQASEISADPSPVMYSSYVRAEEKETELEEEVLNLELLSTKAPAVEVFPDLEYEEERSFPNYFSFRRERPRRHQQHSESLRSLNEERTEELRARSSS